MLNAQCSLNILHSTLDIVSRYFDPPLVLFDDTTTFVTEQLVAPMCAARYDLEDRLVRFAADVCRLTGAFPQPRSARHGPTHQERHFAARQLWRGARSRVSAGLRAQAGDLCEGTARDTGVVEADR